MKVLNNNVTRSGLSVHKKCYGVVLGSVGSLTQHDSEST